MTTRTLLFGFLSLVTVACAAPTSDDGDSPAVQAPTVAPAATVDRRTQNAQMTACVNNCQAQYDACVVGKTQTQAGVCVTAFASCSGYCSTSLGVNVW